MVDTKMHWPTGVESVRDISGEEALGVSGVIRAAGGAPGELHTVANNKRPLDGQNGGAAKKMATESSETVYRLLVSYKKIGSIIGKQGAIIKQIREETGARIKIADAVPNVDERVVIISAKDDQEVAWSPAQDALFRVHNRTMEPDDGPGAPVMVQPPPSTSINAPPTRLLIAGSQAGSLIGKGGDIIKQIRDKSGAVVRILGQEELPACALPTDRVVQIAGEIPKVRTALEMIAKQLRENPPKVPPSTGAGVMIAGGGPRGGFGHLGQLPGWAFGSNSGAGLFQSPGAPGLAGHAPGLSQAGGGGGNMGGLSMGGVPVGLVSTPQVTSQMTVASSLVGSIIGKGGNNIAQIRQISGARVKVHDQKEGSQERVIEITGTADQVSAAQSLVQAFVLSAQQVSVATGANAQPTNFGGGGGSSGLYGSFSGGMGAGGFGH
ncbi:hypothetical protein CBR_g16930 [Chara braunii]|uniref:K Homology domain-containing protein n=1 Tax=Chara braunii TaxID=69332 RepID=A0A388KUB5_CHABU|nr:hypothetical protein CBR_g16930 [Chara braunii]|eukprot:GBG73588.1 hypothetical protein CBR_g16930 [Chara braunii]